MSMLWVGIGAAVVGGAAAYAGSKKQADAATHAANLNQDQFNINNAQQQPFIQSVYGALSKLNTLLGINPNPNSAQQTVAPGNMTVNGPRQLLPAPTQSAPSVNPNFDPSIPRAVGMGYGTSNGANSINPQLRQILSIRADNGDPQAKQLLGMMQ